jgi:hypothetical protein
MADGSFTVAALYERRVFVEVTRHSTVKERRYRRVLHSMARIRK